MKRTLTSLLLLALVRSASAQEIAPADVAHKAAVKLQAALGPLADAPLSIDADAEKPSLLKAGDSAGILIVPDKKLRAASLPGTGSEIVPLGQLWMRKLTLVSDAAPVAASKLRSVTVSDDGKETAVVLFLVGVGRNAGGQPELVVFSKDKEPVLRAPIESINGEKHDTPVTLSGRKSGESAGLLTLDILGRYRAELTVTKAVE